MTSNVEKGTVERELVILRRSNHAGQPALKLVRKRTLMVHHPCAVLALK